MNNLVRHLRKLVAVQQASRSPDHELLARFITDHEEAAFATLLERHGPMVLAVCKRVLQRVHDAEDAWQATFLVLASNAASIRNRKAVASWLHGVAQRVARKLRADIARRTACTARADQSADVSLPDTTAEVTWREAQAVLDEELSRLPEKYRSPLLLCYLEGKTQDEAAQDLGLSNGALRGVLERGRQRLRARLVRRGITLPGALFAAVLAQDAAGACVPAALAVSTTKTALLVAAGQTANTGFVSAKAAALTKGVIQDMCFTKLKILTTLAVLVIGSAGMGFYAYHCAAAQQTESAAKQAGEKPSVAVQPAAAPPAGVRQLLETMKWRITAIDRAKRTISVDDSAASDDSKDRTKTLIFITTADGTGLLGLSLDGLPVAADATITLEGKAAQFVDLKAGMRLELKLSKDHTTISSLAATLPPPPAFRYVLQSVDAGKRTISVVIQGRNLALTLPLAADASIEILRRDPGTLFHRGSLQDLKPGMSLCLKMGPDADGRAMVITEIKTGAK
jgi:RNA polymerase sigma factor (sigma-70 family)